MKKVKKLISKAKERPSKLVAYSIILLCGLYAIFHAVIGDYEKAVAELMLGVIWIWIVNE